MFIFWLELTAWKKKEHSKADKTPLHSILVTLGNRCLIRKSKPLPFHSLKIFAYMHLFTLNIKGGIGWLRPCDAEWLQWAGTERSDPLATTGHESSPAPFTYPYVCSVHGASQIGPINKCSAGFEHQQHIFSDPRGASSGSGHASCKACLSSSACVQQRQEHGQGELPRGFGLWGALFECLTVPLAVHLTVGHGWLFSVRGWAGQFQASLRCIGLGSDRGIACTLTGKCSWRQAVELSVGVGTSLVLEAWDIHHSICTGKRRGNSCKSKDYGTPLQPTL